ncbi:hypothetical protein BC629DRAFT_1596553 [Irpex lacteus]|nr:hypothetical protein BC629DRAFT_1596553 [Irpex lacteus]
MKSPTPAPKRTLYSTGELAESSSSKQNILEKLVSTRPFTQQLDVVLPLPSGSDLQKDLEKLEFTYYRRRWTLSEFIQFVTDHRFEIFSTTNDDGHDRTLAAIGLPCPTSTDSWSFDGETLTISAGEDTWQRFNLGEGTSLPWREHRDIKCEFLYPTISYLTPKLKSSFKAWDEQRGFWDVVYYRGSGIAHSPDGNLNSEARIVKPTVRSMQNVYVPPARIPPVEGEDWDEAVEALFEWVGLASLGSPRLQTTDKPDPYIAVYEPPNGSTPGDLVHMRWSGLIPRSFLRSVLKTVAESHTVPLVCITAHAVLQSPITYVGSNTKRQQQRIPGDESEDTWSLILSREEEKPEGGVSGQQIGVEGKSGRWLLGESIGKWDSRLG